MNPRTSWKASCLFASALLWASHAGAVDGVIEINQAKAQAGAVNGSLATDPAGFPVVISSPGSYKLTGNLTVPNSNATAIEIATANVEIDLNGFSILGPNTCSGSPASCTANGSGIGIHAPAASAVGIRVHGGAVKGMGSTAVALQGWAHVSDLDVEQNGGTGVFTADHSIVENNRVILNGSSGISTFGSSTVRDNHVAANGGNGIEGRNLTRASRNQVSGNGGPTHCGIVSSNPFGGFEIHASQNTVYNNPAGCFFGTCCSLSGAGIIDCNMIQSAAGTLQRCCPNPATGTDVCS